MRNVMKMGLVGLVLWGVLSSQAIANPRGANGDVERMEQTVIAVVNEYRAKHWRGPLKYHPLLAKEARQHSLDMERKRLPFGHQRFGDRIKRIYARIKNCLGGSENVAYFPPSKSPRDVVAMWMTSSGHRRNILGNYNLTGVGIVRDKRGWLYYTQIFIKA